MSDQSMNQDPSSGRIKKAVEFNPIHSKQGILERLFTKVFDGFVYNQIWEDPAVDLAAMQVDHDSRILCIASGGCNLLNYLVAQPAVIHAVDLNRHHIHFTTLKLMAMQHLPSHEALYDFYGYANKPENIERYREHIRPRLDEPTREFWETSKLFRGKRINYFTRNIYRFGAMAYFIRLAHWVGSFYGIEPQALLRETEPQARESLF